jgi:hypothetical protein
MQSSVAEMLARIEPSAVDPSKPTSRSSGKTISSTELAYCLKGLTEPQYNLFTAMYLKHEKSLALFSVFWRETMEKKAIRQKWGKRKVKPHDVANVTLFELFSSERLSNKERCLLLGIGKSSTSRLVRYMDSLIDLKDIHDRAIDKATSNYLRNRD